MPHSPAIPFEKARSNKSRSVSIIGAGNSGLALAADLKKRGFSVCLYAHPDHAKKLDGIAERGALAYRGITDGACRPDLLTKKLEEALAFADNIVLALPSFAQEEMFALMAGHVGNHHRIINLNGNFSSCILSRCLNGKTPVIVETNSAPHASRAGHDGSVEICGVKKFIPIAALTSELPRDAKEAIEAIMPCALEWHADIIAVSLQAYNGVLHPAPLLLNAGWVESREADFGFYRQGVSASVAKVIEKIDEERREIARRYGHHDLRSTFQALKEIYGGDSGSLGEFLQTAEVYQSLRAPRSMADRYVTEDVPFLLVPWYVLGLAAGYEAKTIKCIIEMASVMHGKNYMEEGRTLEKMNLPRHYSHRGQHSKAPAPYYKRAENIIPL